MNCIPPTGCGPTCNTPPQNCNRYDCSMSPIGNTVLTLRGGNSSTIGSNSILSAQPISNGSAYQILPFWIDTSSSLGNLSHLPPLALYYDVITLRIILRINLSCSDCTKAIPIPNSGFTFYILTTTYDTSTQTYGPLQFLPQETVSCNQVQAWAFTPVSNSGSTEFYIQPVTLQCRTYYCRDDTASIQKDTKSIAIVGKGLQPIRLTLYDAVPETILRMNIYTFNALEITKWLKAPV